MIIAIFALISSLMYALVAAHFIEQSSQRALQRARIQDQKELERLRAEYRR